MCKLLGPSYVKPFNNNTGVKLWPGPSSLLTSPSFPTGNPPATGTGTLLITLEDVNDNPPVIFPTVAEVCDDAKNLSVVILGASDKDLHPNTDPFKFEIHKQAVPDKVWKISKINSKSAYAFSGCLSSFEAAFPGPASPTLSPPARLPSCPYPPCSTVPSVPHAPDWTPTPSAACRSPGLGLSARMARPSRL